MGFRENEMYWAHLLDEAFDLSAQFDLSPLSFACVPAGARPTETRSALRLEPHLTKLEHANFIRCDRSVRLQSTFLTNLGFESLSYEVAETLSELLRAQIQIEVYHVSEEPKAFDNEDLG